jgi:hypothetical protein
MTDKAKTGSLSNVRRITKEMLYIHQHISDRLSIDTEISTFISNPENKSMINSEFYNLNLRLFLDYSELLLERLEEQLNEIKLTPTKEYWRDINEAKPALKELRLISKANAEHVKSSKDIFDNLVEQKKELDAAKNDIKSGEKRKFLQYYLSALSVMTLIYFGFITLLRPNAGDIVIAIILYIYIATGAYFVLKRYFKK